MGFEYDFETKIEIRYVLTLSVTERQKKVSYFSHVVRPGMYRMNILFRTVINTRVFHHGRMFSSQLSHFDHSFLALSGCFT